MKKMISLAAVLAVAACGGAQNEQDKKIAENAKKIEILEQEAKIKQLEAQAAQAAAATPAQAASQVYQLAASAVAETIPQNLQEQAKASGQAVTGTDGQQYMFDPDSGNWLLYGAIGAAAGYLMANAMNNKNAAKYQPVTKPTAAVQRVYKDYTVKNPNSIPAPRAAAPAANSANTKPTPNYRPVPTQAAPQQSAQPSTQPSAQPKPTPNYRPTQPSKSGGFGLGGGRRGRR
ncbi:hypothetical protein [Alysiella crassa]|uniref:Membrane lipoprotein n=1 Tax=Alysiella crassa TaxID=153491 RepID=A0A376BU81_9NEIS|nr:hypothetical protein [Alysiella crassa]UOP06044.1 hypothetical protein LVJ80_09325 [Alysiella crassa]SSY80500.1 Uncharacterised protein [Alysiella crassa]